MVPGGMSEYDWLLFLHVTGAFLLTGGTIAAGALNVAAQMRARPSEIALVLSLIRFAVLALTVGALVTLVFGLWLVSAAPYDYGFGQAWVIAAIVVFLIGMVLGEVGGRKDRKTRKLAERLAAEGDAPSAVLKARLRAPEALISYAAGLMPLIVLVLMIWKPGA
jgi:uncharacterized membrane protein